MTLYNRSVIEEAEAVASIARHDFMSISGEGAVTLSAIAGAGKSTFVRNTVGECRSANMRVAVAAPTNEQIFALTASIADMDRTQTVTYVPARDVVLPPWAQRPNILPVSPAHQATGAAVVVGTIDKLASARNPRRASIRRLGAFDALIIDESYQANAGKYYAIGDIAPRHLCVGDSGQIHPFTTVEAGRQWKGLAEDPLQTAVGVLRANHPDTRLHRFPITRRLDGRGAAIARCFYAPEHTFGAAVADGVRQMTLARMLAPTSRERALDQALDVAAEHGWAHIELPAHQVLTCDPDTATAIVDVLARLRGRAARLVCERNRTATGLDFRRVAVGVAHNDQKDLVRMMLDSIGMAEVVVDTANRLQGLEFDVCVCWHPLAGLDEADEFHVEAGRMCVLCTRHRHACIVVGRAGDRQLVEGLPPVTPAWPGIDADQILDGWEAHRGVFGALEPFRVPLN
jgi:hypothetical protein